MEEPIEVRYTFAFMLAICDPTGHVIGTDVAIARRLNMGVPDFQKCIGALMAPDEDSNSKEEEGRRVIPSEGERGYRLVNYLTYRDMKDEEHRRNYMADYMKKYREKKALLTPVKKRKQRLTQAEEEVEASAKEKEEAEFQPPSPPKASPSEFDEFWQAYPKKVGKGDAEKAWNKYGCSKLLPQILTAVRKCKISHDWTKEAGQFIPHPATWLNRRGWDDELMPHRNGNPAGSIVENITPNIIEV